MADLPVITPTGAEAALRETVVEELLISAEVSKRQW